MLSRLVIACVLAVLLLCGAVPAHAAADTIAGHVGTTAGTPVVDVRVDVLAGDGSTAGTATTAGDGSYAATVSAGTYDVRFTPPTGSGYGTLLVRGRATGVPLDVQLVTGSAAALSGVVRDPAGTPITRIAVILRSGTTIVASSQPGADGVYSLSVAPGAYTLSVGANSTTPTNGQTPSGTWTAQTPITISSSLTQDLTVPTIALDASAVGPDGEPVSGTVLSANGTSTGLSLFPGDTQATASFNNSRATTDGAGHARLITFPANTGTTNDNTATPPTGSGLGQTSFDLAGVTSAITISLPRTETLSGVVRDPTGAPITRIAVTLRSGTSVIASSQPGADGAYSLAVAPGSYQLWVGANSTTATTGRTPNGSWTVRTPITISASRTLDLTVPTIAIDAATVSPAGNPVAGTALRATGNSSGLSLFPGDIDAGASFEHTASTDATGHAGLVTFPANSGITSNSTATPPAGSGFSSTTFELLGVTNAITITLPRTETLSGVVRDPAGVPITQVAVILRKGASLIASSQPGTDGAYSLAAAPGDYTLSIAPSGGGQVTGQVPSGTWSVQTPITITSSRTEDLTVPTIAIDTATVGPAGDPVPGTVITANGSSTGLSLFPGNTQATAGFNHTATADATGRARLVTFPANTGVTNNNTATPPSKTTLPVATFDLAGITTNQSLVIAFQQSVLDGFPPLVTCDPPDGAWHAGDVSVQCTAADGGSGLADPADASFSLIASVADGQESANAATNTRRICDLAQNCMTAQASGWKIDRRAPTVTIGGPAEGATFVKGEAVTTQYACSDAGSGVASCQGPVANGVPLDTSTVGAREFTVTATDALGHTRTATSRYTVAAAPAEPTPTHTPTATPTDPPSPGGGGSSGGGSGDPGGGGGGKAGSQATGDPPATVAQTPAPTVTPAPTPATTPIPDGTLPPPVPPVHGQSTTIARVTGTVLITPAGAKTPVRLTTSTTIPNGSEVDATKGTVTVTVATPSGSTDRAQVRDGQFIVQLGAKTTFFRLSQPLSCPRKAKASADRTPPSKKKKKKKVTKRKLWVKDTGGDWGTKGSNAVATNEGTTWITTDTCAATTVKVVAGAVRVKPARGGKAVLVRAPNSRTVNKRG